MFINKTFQPGKHPGQICLYSENSSRSAPSACHAPSPPSRDILPEMEEAATDSRASQISSLLDEGIRVLDCRSLRRVLDLKTKKGPILSTRWGSLAAATFAGRDAIEQNCSEIARSVAGTGHEAKSRAHTLTKCRWAACRWLATNCQENSGEQPVDRCNCHLISQRQRVFTDPASRSSVRPSVRPADTSGLNITWHFS